MSEARFADSALRLCSLAARALGWRPAEFWKATPAELATVLFAPSGAGEGVSRSELDRMMEQHHD